MIGWLIAIVSVVCLLAIPVGVRVIYDSEEFKAALLLGPVKKVLYPKDKEKSKHAKSDFEGKKRQTEGSGGSVDTFLALLHIIFDFLGDLRQRIRISELEMLLTLGSSDPCKTGIHYGRAWGILGSLLPLLENVFVINKRNLNVCCNFMTEKSTIFVRADLKLSLGRTILLLLKYGLRSLREYYRINNTGKAEKNYEPKSSKYA